MGPTTDRWGLPHLYTDDRVIAPALLPFTRHVHPNVITFAGFLCSLLAAFTLHRNEDAIFVNTTIVFVRCLADVMDGNTARFYGKCSRFGHLFDTVADFLFDLILYGWFVTRALQHGFYYDEGEESLLRSESAWLIAQGILVPIVGIVYWRTSMTSHDSLKDYDRDWFAAFVSNNLVMVYTAVVFLVLVFGPSFPILYVAVAGLILCANIGDMFIDVK